MSEPESSDGAVGETPQFAAEIYQHPLGYLLGLEGLALLRAFAGEHDAAFTHARIAEIRELLDHADQFGPGSTISATGSDEVYAAWAPMYDSGNNNMVRQEQPAVWKILNSLPHGVVLDAACGTGRHSAHLAELGHTVIGVDSSPDMLAVARQKLPDIDFREGKLEALPLEDMSVDGVVCGLALMHVPDITAVLSEFARVLRPGGHLVISDWRSMSWNVQEPFVSTAKTEPHGSRLRGRGQPRTTFAVCSRWALIFAALRKYLSPSRSLTIMGSPQLTWLSMSKLRLPSTFRVALQIAGRCTVSRPKPRTPPIRPSLWCWSSICKQPNSSRESQVQVGGRSWPALRAR